MASVGGRVLVRSSRQPFLDAARVLVGEGHDPGMVISMRHGGSAVDALRAKLGVAARLTVNEPATRFARWKPHPGWSAEIPPAGASIIGVGDEEGIQQRPWRERPELTPEQRAAMAARLALVRQKS